MVGSSRKRMSGSCSRQAASSQRIRWPSERSAHRLVEEVGGVEQLAELGDPSRLPCAVQPVDGGEHPQRLPRG